jgi:hypothetical protein
MPRPLSRKASVSSVVLALGIGGVMLGRACGPHAELDRLIAKGKAIQPSEAAAADAPPDSNAGP